MPSRHPGPGRDKANVSGKATGAPGSVLRPSLLILLLLLIPSGCHRKTAVPVAAPTRSAGPPAAVTPTLPQHRRPVALEPAPIPGKISVPSDLELGELNFQLGEYSRAALLYESFLRENPKSRDRDKALFHLALSHSLAGDPNRDWGLTAAALRRLIAESPESPYRDQAEFILRLQEQIEKLRSDVRERDERIKRLSEELQRLKEIDMQRRPTRPP